MFKSLLSIENWEKENHEYRAFYNVNMKRNGE